jgi:hypothetical protein
MSTDEQRSNRPIVEQFFMLLRKSNMKVQTQEYVPGTDA